jgi:hypothetical protein
MPKTAIKYSKEWICTDPATNQYGRQLTEFLFEFKEDGKEITGIDLTGYKNKQIEVCINSFGYTLANNKTKFLLHKEKYQPIYSLYGKQSNWIIAECLFEMDIEIED